MLRKSSKTTHSKFCGFCASVGYKNVKTKIKVLSYAAIIGSESDFDISQAPSIFFCFLSNSTPDVRFIVIKSSSAHFMNVVEFIERQPEIKKNNIW